MNTLMRRTLTLCAIAAMACLFSTSALAADTCAVDTTDTVQTWFSGQCLADGTYEEAFTVESFFKKVIVKCTCDVKSSGPKNLKYRICARTKTGGHFEANKRCEKKYSKRYGFDACTCTCEKTRTRC